MSPISTPVSAPVPGLPLVAPKDVPASPAGTVAAALPALDWLMAWLGENALPAEVPEETSEPPEPPSAVPMQSKIQWLSLLPPVVTFDTPVVQTETGETDKAKEDTSSVAVTVVESATTEPLIPVKKGEIELAADDDTDGAPAELVPLDPVPPMPPLTVAPTQTESQATIVVPEPVRQTEADVAVPARTDQDAAPAVSVAPAQPSSQPPVQGRMAPQPGDILPRLSTKQEDKGEVIWSAEFLIEEKATGAAPRELPSVERTAVATTRLTGTETPESAEKVSEPASKLATGENRPQQEKGQDNPESRADDPEQEQQQPQAPRPRAESKATNEPRRDSRPVAPDHMETKTTEPGARPTTFATEFTAKVTAENPHTSAPVAETAAVEQAAPLKPAQIATVRVDVPAPSGREDMPPLQLVVSQRGEQVNVRVRSWDAGAGPIEESRMQPLLQSLSEKGLVSEAKSASRVNELMPITTERTQEKLMMAAETAAGNNDSQSFQNGNERQQQNQERQQQQQAFFLRKQMRTAESEEFTLQVAAELNRGGIEKGATR